MPQFTVRVKRRFQKDFAIKVLAYEINFLTDFYEIWFFIIPNIVPNETTKNPEKSGIQERTEFLYHYIMYIRYISRTFLGAGCVQPVTGKNISQKIRFVEISLMLSRAAGLRPAFASVRKKYSIFCQ